jgi:hypothetical protein
MRDLRKYWAEVNAIGRGLADSVWVTPTGRILLVEVPAAVAAKMLQAQSHRIATDEEVAEYKADQTEARQRAFHDDLRKKGIAVVPLAGSRR